jgi:tetratricopeptide (TPR) repeat protein
MFEDKYTIIRKILLPLSYGIILIALSIIIYQITVESPLLVNKKDKVFSDSIIPLSVDGDFDDLELSVDMDLMIKGLSYFNVAKNEKSTLKKDYYLKTIRTLTKVIASSLKGEETSDINSVLYYHLAYSYLLFGEEFFEISLNYLIQAEKLNKNDLKLDNTTNEDGKLYILELYEIIGSIYFQLGEYNSSIEYFLKAKKLNVDIVYDLILAQSYYEIENYKNSYKYFEQIYNETKNKKNTPINENMIKVVLLRMCKLHYLMEDYIGAISYYETYAKEYGNSAEIRYVLGKIYETLSFKEENSKKQKQYLDKAIEEWKKSIKLKPNYGRAMLKLWRYNVI